MFASAGMIGEANNILAESEGLMADDPAVRPLLKEVLIENLKALLEQKQERLARMKIVPEADFVGDIADEAFGLTVALQESAVNNLFLQSWRATKGALERVQRYEWGFGAWGFCAICGAPLSAARLMACPETDRCVGC